MKQVRVKHCLAVLATALLVVYPFVVFLLLENAGVRWLAAFLAVAALVRSFVTDLGRTTSGRLSAVAVLVFLGLTFIVSSERLLLLYPVFISAAGLIVFAGSLLYPPTIIERLSAAAGYPVPEYAGGYIRIVTLVWCGFFLMNALASGYLAFNGSLRHWSLYNGFWSYAIMGLLFAGEYIVRQFYKRGHEVN